MLIKMQYVVIIEKQTMTTPLVKVGEEVFNTEKEALEFYMRNRRNGFPLKIHCYPQKVS